MDWRAGNVILNVVKMGEVLTACGKMYLGNKPWLLMVAFSL